MMTNSHRQRKAPTMRRKLPARFWFEATAAVIGLVLFIVTLISREWIELLTGWDPDRGNGALEVGLTVALLGVAAWSAFSARRDFHRAAPA
jgi:hypothetical protein